MNVRYEEEFGQLKFKYQGLGKKVSGIVPKGVIAQGETAVEQYVLKRATAPKRKRITKKSDERKRKIAETNFPITVQHDGETLEGRITDYKGDDPRGYVSILLESPKQYAGSDYIAGCFGMAMAGIRVWDDGGNLTAWTIQQAKKNLVSIYEKKRLAGIVKGLNVRQNSSK